MQRREFLQMAAGAVLAMNTPPDPKDLIEATHALLVSLQAAALAPFLEEWPVAEQRRVVTPSEGIPVLRYFPQIEAVAPDFSHELVGDLVRAAPSLAWRRSYTPRQVGERFLEHYGYTELVGLHGALASERVACGFLLLGPETIYPRHRHEAEEVYVPLSGTAGWQQGDRNWEDLPPGTVIHHARHEPHAMHTHAEPLLGLYLWRSADLNQSSVLDPTCVPMKNFTRVCN